MYDWDIISAVFLLQMKLFLIVISTIVFLIFAVNLFVQLVIFIAEEEHVIDQVKIYQLFESKRFIKVRDQMLKQNYTLLIGNSESGVKNFIEHQSNLQALEGKAVVIKRYQSGSKEKLQLLNKIKETKFYMQLALGLGRKERTEVFFINHAEPLPETEIKFIRDKYPRDNIVVVSEDDQDVTNVLLQLKGFKKINFPSVKIQEIQQALKYYYHMDLQEIDSFVESQDESVEKIFHYFKRKAKREAAITDELVQVDDIEDMNQISHEIAQKDKKKLIKKIKAEEKEKQETKQNKQASSQKKSKQIEAAQKKESKSKSKSIKVDSKSKKAGK